MQVVENVKTASTQCELFDFSIMTLHLSHFVKIVISGSKLLILVTTNVFNFLGGQLFLKYWPNSLAEPNVNLEKNCENIEWKFFENVSKQG